MWKDRKAVRAGWLPAIPKTIIQRSFMRKDIHPDYVDCKVTCACGNTFEVKSNKPELSIDICNECHPFFTGSEKIVDAAGRVDKFKKKYKLG
jgi:large subunit ribosomal protein L31